MDDSLRNTAFVTHTFRRSMDAKRPTLNLPEPPVHEKTCQLVNFREIRMCVPQQPVNFRQIRTCEPQQPVNFRERRRTRRWRTPPLSPLSPVLTFNPPPSASIRHSDFVIIPPNPSKRHERPANFRPLLRFPASDIIANSISPAYFSPGCGIPAAPRRVSKVHALPEIIACPLKSPSTVLAASAA
jgi:hypothetical protein